MTVERSEIRRIADLARLGIDGDEVDRLTDEMNRILEYASRLRDLAGASEESGASEGLGSAEAPLGRGTRSRRVERRDTLFGSVASLAPEEAEGFFVVPPPPGLGEGSRPGRPAEGT